MKVREEIKFSVACASVALCLDFVSGRALAVFYAQMGSASWAGVAVSGLLFGLVNAVFVCLLRRTGAQRPGDAFQRLCGVPVGNFMGFLYHIIMAMALCMLACQAAHAAMLALPIRNAALWGMLCAFFLAGGIALSGAAAVRGVGVLLALCCLLFEFALLNAAVPDASLHWALVLRLRGNYFAALCFAVFYTCAGLCLCAAMCIGRGTVCMNACRVGVFSGGSYLLLLAMGNAVLQGGREEILGLEEPFVALAAGWGSSGFFVCTAMLFLFSMLGMAAILRALLQEIGCGK